MVGTAYVLPSEEESHRGRILVYRLHDKQLHLVAEREVTGGVLCLAPFNGKILAGVNTRVILLKFTESDEGNNALSELHSHHGHTGVIQLKTRGDFVVVVRQIRWTLVCT